MNNDETPSTPAAPQPTPPTPDPIQPETPAPQPQEPQAPVQSEAQPEPGVWVSKDQYNSLATAAEQQIQSDVNSSIRLRTFYTMLAVTGLLLFVLYVGMLVAPSEMAGRGNCTQSGFFDIAFWLNPLAYALLLATGIVGTTTKRTPVVVLSGFLIAAAPIAWFFTGLSMVAVIFCGV